MNEAALEVNVRAGYGKQTVLENVSFSLEPGERLGFVGSSGAGKSTLVLALLGLLPWRRGWAEGQVLLQGENLLRMKERDARRVRGKRVALVPQSPLTALNSAISLRTHFREAWRAHEVSSDSKLQVRMEELMERVQLPYDDGFLARKPTEISVGQAQRVVLAMALLHKPTVLIADEPTSSLDPVTQVEVLQLLREASVADGTALLYISHDLLSVLQLCERVALLERGRVAEDLSVQDVETHARHPAMIALLRTLPAPAHVLLGYARNKPAIHAPHLVAS